MYELDVQEMDSISGGVEASAIAGAALHLGGRLLLGAAIGTGVGLVLGVGAYIAYEYVMHKD